MTTPSITVIIVSYNRKSFLEDTIRYCYEQSYRAIQVIVVDASEDHLLLTNAFVNSFGESLLYIKWPEVGNISKQRNAGLKRAIGEIVLFLDDDVNFDQSLFTLLIERFERFSPDAITGLIQSDHRAVSKEVFVFKDNVLLYLGQPSFHQCDFLVETYLISAACFAVKREVICEIGGFDEQLAGVFDDSDVGIRLAASNFFILHDNKIKVYHYAAKNSGSRSPKLGLDWKYTNICYLQLKHFYKGRENNFYKKALWQLIKPSRGWKQPFSKLQHIKSFKRGYAVALQRLSQGPIYLSAYDS
jgi:GT2 family glycosyltransferase